MTMKNKRNMVLTFVAAASLGLAACGGTQEEAESPEMDGEGPMEEAGEWTDDAADDTADAFEEGAEETADAFDEAEDDITDDEVDE